MVVISEIDFRALAWPVILVFVTAVSYWGMHRLTANYPLDVAGRFLEHVDVIPSQKNAPLTLGTFKTWLDENTEARKLYAFPVIIPIDIIFLVIFGSMLAVVTTYFADLGYAREHALVSWWWWWIIPVAYIIFDIIEDGLVVWFCVLPKALGPLTFKLLRFFTGAKLFTVALSFGQVAGLALFALKHAINK